MSSGQSICIVGQVLALDESGRRMVIQPDLQNQTTLDIILPNTMECAELRDVKFVEVRGVAESDREITLKEYCNFKDNFDLKTYNEVLKLTTDPSFRHIFGRY